MFGKKQNFGRKNTFASPEYLAGKDQFGVKNYGLKSSDLPSTDPDSWDHMVSMEPTYIPERVARKRVLTLHQKEASSDMKKAQVKTQAAAKVSESARKTRAIAEIEMAAKSAETETKRLKKVADSLQSIKA